MIVFVYILSSLVFCVFTGIYMYGVHFMFGILISLSDFVHFTLIHSPDVWENLSSDNDVKLNTFGWFLVDSTNSRAYATVLCLSVCRLYRMYSLSIGAKRKTVWRINIGYEIIYGYGESFECHVTDDVTWPWMVKVVTPILWHCGGGER